MLCEGTYPYFKGGVSVWTHNLISSLKEFEFIVVSIIANPFYEPMYKPPKNVIKLISVPLWGTELVREYAEGVGIKETIVRSWKTKERSIKTEFIPHLKTLLEEIKHGGRNPKLIGECLYEMHAFLSKRDYKKVFRSKAVWNIIREHLIEDPLYRHIKTSSLIDMARIIQHLLRILAYKYPEVDLCHSSAAAFCGIPAVITKIENNTPYILTEHGVYFRERMLDAVRMTDKLVERIFWVNFYKAIATLNYYYADKLLPVCNFNVNWELELGVPTSKVEVIYNGVNIEKFKPIDLKLDDIPRIVMIGRIDKLKDIVNLIEAMVYVVKEFKDAVCEIYGPVDDEEYFELCKELVKQLKLEKNVLFMGATNKPEIAYNRATIVVQPSLSEGFPFSVVEAMACGKPVVATDVGGVKEALGEAGVIVPPRSPKDLAEAIIALLKDEKTRDEIGRKARERAEKLFSYQRFIEDYKRVYIEVISERRLK